MPTHAQVKSRGPPAQTTIPRPRNRPSGYGIAARMISSCIRWKRAYTDRGIRSRTRATRGDTSRAGRERTGRRASRRRP